MFTAISHLVLQHGKKHSIAIVQGGFSVAECLVRHLPHIQVFHTYDIIPIGYLGRQFVCVVLAAAGDMSLKSVDFEKPRRFS